MDSTASPSVSPDSGLGSPEDASEVADSYSGGLIGSLWQRSGAAKVTNSVSDTVQQGIGLKSLYQIPLAGEFHRLQLRDNTQFKRC